ncbi:DNA recombination protein RmuC [Horticoccus luteus]|uniref:DNA recombination protein RmuC n=1 Tax=Horticoccus luteus TaxID=2862869 RepID=A0A8F9TTL4_9BACT|nr:DNA recombination protein RmuC [Horticoccus luteus]QYM77862.1 DNA recombination protein RmuC [Horticoccus luteus]
MLFTTALLAAFAGGLLTYLFLRSRHAVVAERLRARDLEVAQLTQQADSTRAELSHLATLHAAAAAQLTAERAAHERLTTEFKALSADALRVNRTDFLDQAKQAFAQLHQQSTGELDKRQQAIDALVKPLKESLDKVDHKIAEIEKTRASAYGALTEQLKSLNTAQVLLQTEASRLSTALRSTSYVGSWGELQLRRVVEMADMLNYCDFSEQEASGALRADLVVRLPGGNRIVVDAKAPLESYRAAIEATDETARGSRLAEHAAKVRGHIDSLGAKNYWEQFQPAPEFVVLFLPGDHFLTAALQTDRTLMDRALTRRVLLATPTTLIALLKAAAYGWRQEAISKNADEISALGRQLYDRVATFADNLDKVGRGLDTAIKGYNAAVGSFEQTLLPGARKFAELGARGAKELSPAAPVETAVRDVVKKG